MSGASKASSSAGVAGQADRVVGGHAGLPAVGHKVVGHRADHIGFAVEEVDPAVAVEVDGVFDPAAGHELWPAHGTGVAAQQRLRVHAAALGEAQELLQLRLEEGASFLCARVLAREIEGERGERVDDAKVAGVLPVERFNPDHAHDQAGGHAKLGLRPLQPCAVFQPELAAGLNPHGLDEPGTVGRPVLGCAAGRRAHQPDGLRQALGLSQLLPDPIGIEVASHGQIDRECHGIRMIARRERALAPPWLADDCAGRCLAGRLCAMPLAQGHVIATKRAHAVAVRRVRGRFGSEARGFK